ncbi:nitronate monooxygenase [Micromonospora sp. DR5-3]|uniref:NAD(P)H-dependent flavin oxidoreductase n=1 Tax=unclassified Micromonospora TaxID=2617518 RepID=UPI0011D780BC|nr:MULTISPECIES: nitronate monooxygenase [unclassified Micromonospora]MCW3820494.1 nitronate monooxygenase [Micromonospora sp. DR5-3]TYC19294.1 nitronate monooxygenase [Micromonospora sp. MP36]
MASPLDALGVDNPVLAAPMAGGPSTPALVTAAARANGLGFLAGGYKTADALAEQIAEVRRHGITFGVNLFAPSPLPVDPEAFRRYAAAIAPEARAYELDVQEAGIVEDDDHWSDKIDLLLSAPVPVVSFTFAIPDAAAIASLRAAGTLVVQTVTSPAEARLAADAGADVLAVQASAAGGHSGTLTPEHVPASIPLTDLLGRIRKAVSLPLVAAGGLATPADVAEALRAGAEAVMVGTVLLRADEAGTSLPHRAALADPTRRRTVVTRAFTGRPARALPNRFTDHYSDLAPSGYPALHHLTRPMRQAAAAAGDPERINLWAGTGYRHATAEPAAQILRRLASHA